MSKIRPRRQTSGDVHVAGDNGGDDRDIHNSFHFGDGLIGDWSVDHHAGGALVLRVLRQAHGAVAVGHAAAHTHKHRHLGHADDGLGDGGLRGKGINRNDGVRIHILDNGHIGGKNQGLDSAAKDTDAAAVSNTLGNREQMAAERSAVLRDCLHGHSLLFYTE